MLKGLAQLNPGAKLGVHNLLIDGELVGDKGAVEEALCAYWTGVFQPHAISEEEGNTSRNGWASCVQEVALFLQ